MSREAAAVVVGEDRGSAARAGGNSSEISDHATGSRASAPGQVPARRNLRIGHGSRRWTLTLVLTLVFGLTCDPVFKPGGLGGSWTLPVIP
jgi:hypothetical protein